MKNSFRSSFFLFLTLLYTSSIFSQNIVFKDEELKETLVKSRVIDADLDGKYDTDADLDDDGEISQEEADLVKAIKITWSSIKDPSDLEHFGNLRFLILKSTNKFDSLDLQKNPLLEEVTINTNVRDLTLINHPTLRSCDLVLHKDVSSINFRNNSNLERLVFRKSSDTPSIDSIIVTNNGLSEFYLNFEPNSTESKYLDLSHNQLSKLGTVVYQPYDFLDLSNNMLDENSFTKALPEGHISNYSNNNFTTITLQGIGNLQLNISGNPLKHFKLNGQFSEIYLEGLDFTEFDDLESIEISKEGYIGKLIGSDLLKLNTLDLDLDTSAIVSFSNCPLLETLDLRSKGSFYLDRINPEGIKDARITTFDSLVITNSIVGDILFGNKYYARKVRLEDNPEMTSIDINPPFFSGAKNISMRVINSPILTSIAPMKFLEEFNLILNRCPSLEVIDIDAKTTTLHYDDLPSLRYLKMLGKNNVLRLHSLPLLKTVELTADPTTDYHLRSLPSLDTLILKGKAINDIYLEALPKLSYFKIGGYSTASSCNPVKSELVLRDLPNLSTIDIQALCVNRLEIAHLPKLSKLKLRYINAGAQDVILSNNPLVTALDIVNVDCKDLYIREMEKLTNVNILRSNVSNSMIISETPLLTAVDSDQSRYHDVTLQDLPELSSIAMKICPWIPKFNAVNLPKLTSLVLDNRNAGSANYKMNILLQELPLLSYFALEGRANIDTIDLSECPSLDSLELNYGSNDLKLLNLANGNDNLSYFDPPSYINFGSLEKICVDSPEEKNNLMRKLDRQAKVEYTEDCMSGLGYTTISGNVSLIDDDGVEYLPSALYLPMTISRNGQTSTIYTTNNGRYSQTISQLGDDVEIETDIDEDVFERVNSIKSYTIDEHKGYFNQNHTIHAIKPLADLQVYANITSEPRPGEQISYILEVKNRGPKSTSGELIFDFPDDVLTLIDGGQLRETENGRLSGNLSVIEPYSSIKIKVTFLCNTPTDEIPLIGGEQLAFQAEVISQSEELLLTNNKSTMRQTVVNSYDPNNILCVQGGTVKSNDDIAVLNYTINFENLGSSFARNVKIENVLDTSLLDISTFELLDFSDNVHSTVTGEKVIFYFESINLPATSNNTGYVSYSIKPKVQLEQGDSISNQADIYFDFNPPITTEEHNVILDISLSAPSVKEDGFSLYPNPSHGQFILRHAKESPLQILLLNTNGSVVKSLDVDQTKFQLNLSTGVYYLNVIYKDGLTTTQKLILMK